VLRLITRRVLIGVPLLLFVSFSVFVLIDLAPGDPAASLAGENATPEQVAAIRQNLHLDDSIFVRYGHWLADAVHGDLGSSLKTGQSVSSLIAEKLTITASIVGLSLVFVILLALVGGVIGAVRPGGLIDRFVTVVASIATAIPPFWLALVLIVYFAINRSWFPAVGYVGLDEGFLEWFKHLVLPAVALAAVPAAELALQLRGSLVEVLGRDYIVTTRANGLTSMSIIGKHGLKNAAIPVVTVLGFRIAQLLGGTVTIELVFNINGLGRLAVNSTLSHDIPVLLGLVVVTTLVVLIINVLVDISYGYFNPKVRV
jgi:peptide/nickel transport system permease protein